MNVVYDLIYISSEFLLYRKAGYFFEVLFHPVRIACCLIFSISFSTSTNPSLSFFSKTTQKKHKNY